MSYSDMDKYAQNNANGNRPGLQRRQSRAPATILDLFSRPLADFDFFAPDKVFSSGDNFKVDIKETDDCYELIADMPGTKKEDIKLSLDHGVLSISAVHHSESEQTRDGYLVKERSHGSYERAFALENVDENNIDATFESGTLKVVLPKRNAGSGKTISIK